MSEEHEHEWVKVNQTRELIFLRRDVIAWVWDYDAMQTKGPWRVCPTCTRIEAWPEEPVHV